MGILKVDRTAITSWSPTEPYLALGTVAGALDASFSSKTELEIFAFKVQDSGPTLNRIAGIAGNARFNRICWGAQTQELLGCGKENGEIELFNVETVLNESSKSPSIFKSNTHSGAVRGLHFNPTQTHLLASGATDGEILIWDLNELNKPYAPGAKSQRLEDVTCLAWNKDVPHILASGSSNGYTVVWDLRNRKELLKIPYPGGRKPVTAISWNPDKPTQMVTCCDDDANPVILMWDLRNASAAEKTLSGHSKGILSMDWCPKDSELLLSCGKDNRTIVWNATTGDPIGDLAHSSNWSFDTKWCPRNPDLCVTASFDGKVVLHSIQNAADHTDEDAFSPVPAHVDPVPVDPNDPFAQVGTQDLVNNARNVPQPIFCLPHPPKWLRRPVGATWGFGGRLVFFDSSHPAVYLKAVPVDEEIAFRAAQLGLILKEDNPETSAQYCDYMANSEFVTGEQERTVWLFLKRLFSPESRENMADFIGYDQNFTADERLARVVAKLDLLGKEPTEKEAAEKKVVPFSLYSSQVSEESDTDKLITKAVLVGDFDMAVSLCLGAKRFADALVLAVNGSPELLQKAQQHFFDHFSGTRSYVRVLRSIVDGDLSDLIAGVRLDSKDGWKDLISLICTYSKPEDFTAYFSALGGKIADPGFTGIKDKSTKELASSLCYLGAGDVQRLSSLWFSTTSLDVQSSIRDKPLQSLIERFSLFRQAVHFQDPALALESAPEEVEHLKPMYNVYVRYAWNAAAQGSVDVAWRFLEHVPLNFIPDTTSIDIFVLRDRVYASKGHISGVSGQAPAFPFEVVDVLDLEALRFAAEIEEKQRLAAQQQIQAQQQQQQAMFQNKSNQQQSHHYGSRANSFLHQYESQANVQQSSYQQPPSWSGQTQQQHSWAAPNPPVSNQWQQPPPPSNTWNQPPPNQWSNPSATPWTAQPPPPTMPPPTMPPSNTWNQPPNQWPNPAPQNTPPAPWTSHPPNQSAPAPPPPIPRPGTMQSGSSGTYQTPPPPVNFNRSGSFTGNARKQSVMEGTAQQTSAFQQNVASPPVSFQQNAASPPVSFQQNAPPPPVSFQQNASSPPVSFQQNAPHPPTHLQPPEPPKVIRNPKDKACYDRLQNLLKSVDKKSMEDAEKKLSILYGLLCQGQVESAIVKELQSLCSALDQSDFTTAQRILNELMTKRFEATGSWVLGVKKIVDGLERASRPVTSPLHASPTNLAYQPSIQTSSQYGQPPQNNFVPPQNNFVAPPSSLQQGRAQAPTNTYNGTPQLTYGQHPPIPQNNPLPPPPTTVGPPPIPGGTQNFATPPPAAVFFDPSQHAQSNFALHQARSLNNPGPGRVASPPTQTNYTQHSSTVGPPPISRGNAPYPAPNLPFGQTLPAHVPPPVKAATAPPPLRQVSSPSPAPMVRPPPARPAGQVNGTFPSTIPPQNGHAAQPQMRPPPSVNGIARPSPPNGYKIRPPPPQQYGQPRPYYGQ